MKRIASIGKNCVACGSCAKACPTGAATIYKGIKAVINANICVGCGKCLKACPAHIITLINKEPVI